MEMLVKRPPDPRVQNKGSWRSDSAFLLTGVGIFAALIAMIFML